MGVTVWSTFMDGCEWMRLFRLFLQLDVGECDCSKHIYECVSLFRIHLLVGVSVCNNGWV